MNKNRRKVIELIGHPGSGKSYVAKSLQSTANVEVSTNPGKVSFGYGLTGRILASGTAPFFSLTLHLSMICRRGVRAQNFRILHLVQKRYIALLRAPRSGVSVVVDDGPLHALYSALFGTRRTTLSDWFLGLTIRRLLKVQDTFVMISIEKDACVSNFRGRLNKGSRFNSASSEELVTKFLADTTYDDIIGAIRRKDSASLVRCADTAEARQRIESLLTLALQGGSGVGAASSDRPGDS